MYRLYRLAKWFFNIWFRWFPQEMVQYWKTGDKARAKLVVLPDGSYAMIIEGEKYPLYGFPRGPVLFGPLARLKHLAKNLVFNEVWKMLAESKTNAEVMTYIRQVALPVVAQEINKSHYDMFPPERLCPAVRELWRALTVIEKDIASPEQFRVLKQGLTFYFQEDDAYRFRLQWLAKYLDPHSWWRRIYYFGRTYSFRKEMEFAFKFLENAEIVPDMKGRTKLVQRVLSAFLDDSEFGKIIEAMVKELNWKKLYLSKSDKYFFRGKYFKVDLERYDY